MALPEFRRQTAEPLYREAIYNRPITRRAAGRMLLVGGYASEFSLPTTINQMAIATGIGECNVVLPDKLVQLLGGAPGTYFVPSTVSGSLAPEALGRILELSEESDSLAVGASLSNNSQTSILIERLLEELDRPLIAYDDALVAMKYNLGAITNRSNALIVATMAEMFKVAGALGVGINIRPGGGLVNKLEIIRDVAAASHCDYAVYGTEIVTVVRGDMVVTPINYRLSLVPAVLYGVLGTFWTQNPSDRQAGLTTGAYVIAQAAGHLGATERPSINELAKAVTAVLRAHDDF